MVGLCGVGTLRLEAEDPADGRGAYKVQRPGPSARSKKISRGQSPTDVSANRTAIREPIQIRSRFGWNWQSTEGGWVHLLRGECELKQGSNILKAQQAVIWVRAASPQSREQRVLIYLEDQGRSIRAGAQRSFDDHSTVWMTTGGIEWDIGTSESESLEEDAFYQRAMTHLSEQEAAATRAKSKKTPSARPQAPADQSGSVIFPEAEDHRPAQRRLRFYPRSSTPFNAYSFETPNTTPAEQVLVITNGVTLVIDGLASFGTIGLTADHMVVWTQAVSSFDDQASEAYVQSNDAPLQIYLEGNIEIRQNDPQTGKKFTTAKRAFYDLRENRAILQNVELKVKTPDMPLAVRIHAEEIRQQSKNSFRAVNAWVSTSQFGKPGYRLEAPQVLFEQRPTGRRTSPTTESVKTASGDDSAEPLPPAVPEPETTPWITTIGPTVRVEDTPVFWFPRISGPLQSMATPLRKFNVENDRIFGSQLRTGWDLFKLFGQDAPAGVDAVLLADILSQRGPAAGLVSNWQNYDPFGWGDSKGLINAYGINDSGNDNLGLDRRSLAPPDPWRGRFLFRNRQDFGDEWTLMTEVGYISDRNFLEQYFEPEWDTGKDNETLAYLKHQSGDTAWSVMTRARINDFDTTTEWLPKGDLYVLGRSLFDGRMNWSSHTSVGFANLKPAVAPTDPKDIFTPLPFVADRSGLVTQTRHEISAPFMLGQMNVVPYALGEAAYFSEDLNGNSMLRLYGSAGVRGSLMFTKSMPEVQSSILGLRGLTHKMILDFDYSISDSSQNLGDVAQYNEFDDQAQYRFRDRLVTNTFGGILPDQFDPRFYAVRAGAGHNVTAPYFELVDAQQVLRMGWRHRWQTQAGPIDNPRIRDWMTLDLEASYFPNADRDNFGQSFGLLGGRYAFNVSERTSILANAYFDLFDNAQQLWNVGIVSQRSERGSVYLGVRQVKGAGLDSEILTASYSYQMSPKWVSTFGTAYDLAEGRNRGQSLTMTRVGKDFLLHLGANFDASKNNAGIMLSIEPKFFPMASGNSTNQLNPQLGSLSGGF